MSRQARSLDVLLAEINARAPRRSKASDGGLGDQAHASRTSDHNPNAAGVWTAYDFTDDPAGGLDGSQLAQLLKDRLGTHPALKSGAYIIHNARICSFDRRGEGWRQYTGANDHTKHVHLSVSADPAGYDSVRPWHLWAASEPVAPVRVPTILDITVALERFSAASTNPRAKLRYGLARRTLGTLVSSDERVRVPGTVAGVVELLEVRAAAASGFAKTRLEFAIKSLRPLA